MLVILWSLQGPGVPSPASRCGQAPRARPAVPTAHGGSQLLSPSPLWLRMCKASRKKGNTGVPQSHAKWTLGQVPGCASLLQGRQGHPKCPVGCHIGPHCFPGQLNRDVTYGQLYAFLSCLQVSWPACLPMPCPHLLCSPVIRVLPPPGQPLPRLDDGQQDPPDAHLAGKPGAGPGRPHVGSFLLSVCCSVCPRDGV